MKTRLPIYVKILGWFFLNLLVLGGVAYVLAQRHFGWGSDWLLTPESRTRIRSMLTALRDDLDNRPANQWNAVFERFGAAYHMKFGLFRNQGASYLAGEKLELPTEVTHEIASHPSNPNLHPGPPRGLEPPFDLFDSNPFPQPREGRGPPDGEPPPREGRAGPGEPTSDIITTKNPKRYWLLMRGVRFEQNFNRGPQPTTVVAMTDSLSQSSLLFDPTPWLYAAGGMLVFSVLFWLPLVRSLTRATKQMTDATRMP